MRLTFEQFRKKLAETKVKIAKAFVDAAAPKTAGKLSQTQRRKTIRARKTAARAACDSFRWLHKHNHHASGRLHGWR